MGISKLFRSKANEYQWHDLGPNEFRILTLLRGALKDDIRLEIRHEFIDGFTDYTALSYAWYNVKPRDKKPSDKRVYIGDKDKYVTSNLLSFLKQLRTADTDISIWVDALSINLNDDREKSIQLGHMSRIYSNAAHIASYLGEDDNTIREAFDTLRLWANAHDNEQMKPVLAAQLEKREAEFSGNRVSPLQRFFNREYFYRAWIMHELRGNKERGPVLICGEHRMDWSEALRGFLAMQSAVDDLAFDCGLTAYCMASFATMAKMGDEQMNLTHLVPLIAMFDSTHAQDNVYAALSLAECYGNRYPAPDASMSKEQVALVYTRAMMESDGVLSILSSVDPVVSRKDGLPSWALKLDRLRHYSMFGNAMSGYTMHLFDAGLGLTPMTEPPSSRYDTTLRLYGHRFDTVTAVHDVTKFLENDIHKDPCSWSDIVRRLRDFAHSIRLPAYYDPTGENMAAALTRVFTLNDQGFNLDREDVKEWEASTEPIFQRYQEDEDYFECPLTQDQIGEYVRTFNPGEAYEWCPEANKYQQHLTQNVHEWLEATVVHALCGRFNEVMLDRGAGMDRKLIVLKSGYIGVTSDLCKVGDEIYVFPGGRVAFALRSMKEGTYSLVGEAFVHGIMFGEAMKEHLAAANASVRDLNAVKSCLKEVRLV